MTTERSTSDRRTHRQATATVEDPNTAPIEPILESLTDPNPTVRSRAATALYTVSKQRPDRLVDADALPQIARLLETEDDRPTLRTKAITTIANVGATDAEAIVPYADVSLEALEDDSALVRQGALEALRHVASVEPDAVRPALDRVVSALGSHLERTRLHAAEICREVGPEPEPEAVRTVVEPLLDLLEDSYDPLTDSGISYDPTQTEGRATPADQLRGYRFLVGDPQGRSSNVRARAAAAAALAAIAEDAPVPTADVLESRPGRVAALLGDRNLRIRRSIAAVVAAVAEAAPATGRRFEADLLERLEDDFVVSGNAVWALRYVDSEGAREALERVAAGDDVEERLRATAESALAELDS